MDEKRLAQIEVRAAAATPGPWRHESFPSGTEYVHMRNASSKDGPRVFGPDKSDQDGHIGAHMTLCNVPAFQVLTGETEQQLDAEKRANAAFIARSRQDVVDLVAEVRRLRGQGGPPQVEESDVSYREKSVALMLEAAEELRQDLIDGCRFDDAMVVRDLIHYVKRAQETDPGRREAGGDTGKAAE